MSTYPILQREREIWHACDDLIAMGKSVREITGEAISWRLRELKYKAGSKTYIYKYRDSWMTARGLSKEEQGSLIATELSDPIARATAVFKEGLQRELEREYEQKYIQLQTQLLERDQHISLLEETNQRLQEQQIEQNQRYTILTERYELQSQERLVMHEEAISHKMLITQLERQLTEARSYYEQVIQQSDKQRQVLEVQYQTSLTELREQSKQHLAELKIDFEKQNNRLTNALEMLKIELQESISRYRQVELHSTELKMQIQSLEKKLVMYHSFDEKLKNINPSLENLANQLVQIKMQQESEASSLLNKQSDLQTSLLQIIDRQHSAEENSLRSQKMIEKLITANEQMKEVAQ